eukprot:scaffold59608_cov57-Phaeocystis_antarctica.AAC.3
MYKVTCHCVRVQGTEGRERRVQVHTHGTRRTRHANPCTLSTPYNASGLDVTHPADTAVDIEEGTERRVGPRSRDGMEWWRARTRTRNTRGLCRNEGSSPQGFRAITLPSRLQQVCRGSSKFVLACGALEGCSGKGVAVTRFRTTHAS